MSTSTIIVTGGAGYIGSHTVLELTRNNYKVIILDNLSNASVKQLEDLKKQVNAEKGKDATDFIRFYNIDLCDSTKLDYLAQATIKKNEIQGIIHFAAFKNVGDSSKFPLEYYNNNLKSLLNILDFAKKIQCPNLIFSSSATVYPHDTPVPFKEVDANSSKPSAKMNNDTKHKTIVTGPHPYGTSKIICEQIMHDIAAADAFWNITILRYFNPAGYDKSGNIGEDINTYLQTRKQQNLFPSILMCKQTNQTIKIFGDNYNTPDGTPIRDYIHITDLAKAHVKSLHYSADKKGMHVFNVGIGKGQSVKEVLQSFIDKGFNVHYEIAPKREGDAEVMCADCTKANTILGWKAELSLEDMVESTIHYYTKNYM